MCNAGAHRHPDHIHSDVVHVATTTPVCVYSVDTRKQHLSCVDLYDVFPGSTSRYQSYRPRIRLAPLGFPLDANIIIHDELVHTACDSVVLLLNMLSKFTYGHTAAVLYGTSLVLTCHFHQCPSSVYSVQVPVSCHQECWCTGQLGCGFLGPLFDRVDLIKPISKCPSDCPYVHAYPSTKRFFDFNEIWHVGRGQRVMHNGMQYDPTQGQGHGHEPFRVGNLAVFKSYLRHLQWELATDQGFLN